MHCVSWAPNLGRSYHLIATASADGRVRIFKVAPEDAREFCVCIFSAKQKKYFGRNKNFSNWFHFLAAGGDEATRSWSSRELAQFSEHAAEVWRVEWNVTGSTLASSGDDG